MGWNDQRRWDPRVCQSRRPGFGGRFCCVIDGRIKSMGRAGQKCSAKTASHAHEWPAHPTQNISTWKSPRTVHCRNDEAATNAAAAVHFKNIAETQHRAMKETAVWPNSIMIPQPSKACVRESAPKYRNSGVRGNAAFGRDAPFERTEWRILIVLRDSKNSRRWGRSGDGWCRVLIITLAHTDLPPDIRLAVTGQQTVESRPQFRRNTPKPSPSGGRNWPRPEHVPMPIGWRRPSPKVQTANSGNIRKRRPKYEVSAVRPAQLWLSPFSFQRHCVGPNWDAELRPLTGPICRFCADGHAQRQRKRSFRRNSWHSAQTL